MDLHGKRTLMTGVTGDLGPSLVEAFLALGAEVLAASPHRTALDALRADMRQHERLEVAECDLTDPAGTERLFDAWTRRGGADVVVHAAGARGSGSLEDHGDEELRDLVASNLLTAAVVLRAALRRMRPQGRGSVVMLAADGPQPPQASEGLYGAARAAVLHLVTSTAAHAGVRVNAVLSGALEDEESRRAVARAAVWLASDEGRGIHGSLLRGLSCERAELRAG